MQRPARRDGIDAFLMSVARIAALVAVAALIYLLYALFSSAGFLSSPERFTPPQQAAIAERVRWACQAFMVGTVFLLGALVYRSRAFPEIGYAQALWGVVLLFGGPWLVETAVGGATPARVAGEVTQTFRAMGALCLAAGAIYALLDVWERMQTRRPRQRTKAAILTSPKKVREAVEARGKPRDVFLGKCWNLPSCRPQIRPHCPVFQRHQGPCWRKGVGCMCAEEVILIAARNEGNEFARGSKEQPFGFFVLPTLEEMERRLPRKEKRERCGRCVIYLHHQEQKYHGLVWTAAAAIVASIVIWRPLWHRLYVQGATATERITRAVSLPTMPTKAEEQHPALQNWVGRLSESTTVEWILIVCVALVLLTYILRAVEFGLYRLRI
jgi:hypothetical protein